MYNTRKPWLRPLCLFKNCFLGDSVVGNQTRYGKGIFIGKHSLGGFGFTRYATIIGKATDTVREGII